LRQVLLRRARKRTLSKRGFCCSRELEAIPLAMLAIFLVLIAIFIVIRSFYCVWTALFILLRAVSLGGRVVFLRFILNRLQRVSDFG
jgi:hypothetical protein